MDILSISHGSERAGRIAGRRFYSHVERFPKLWYDTNGNNHVTARCWPSILHRWEVVRMRFDFKDLMAFGMFILALLTLIVLISQ